MSMIQLARPIAYPHILGRPNTASPGPGGTTALLEANAEYVGPVLTAPRDMVISHIGSRIGTATGSPQLTGAVIQVDTTHPGGTLWATNTSGASGVISANSDMLIALTAAATVSAGQMFGLRFTMTAGTAVQLQRFSGMAEGEWALPYNARDNSDLHGGPGPHLMNVDPETFVIGSSATSFYPIRGFYPASSAANNDWNNTHATLIRGLRMRLARGVRIVGIRCFTRPGGNGQAKLWSDDGTLLATGTFSGGVWGGGADQLIDTFFTEPVVRAAGTFVRVTRQPTTSTAISEAIAILPSADYRSAWLYGTGAQYMTTDGVDWNGQTDRLPLMALLIDQIEETATPVPAKRISLGLRFRVAA